MAYEPKNGPAPSDEEAGKAWEQIMRLAEDHALILQAYGGTAVLAIPRVQRETEVDDGERTLRERVLKTGLWELEDSGESPP